MAKTSLRKINEALDKLPEELDAMYDETMERIREKNPEYASLGLKIIRWVHHAARPLSLQELRHALAVEVDDKTFDEEGLVDEGLLEPNCAGLITIHNHRTLRLVHYTAQEYFSRNSSTLFPCTDAMIAEICLTYLCFEDFRSGPCDSDDDMQARLEQYPLLNFAAQHWAQHVRAVPNSDLDWKILDFFTQESNVEASIQAMLVIKSRQRDWTQKYIKGLNGLCLASMHGLQSICMRLLEQGANVNSTDACGFTSLHYATIYDHGSIVRLLLKADANLEMLAKNDDRTVLQLAAWLGRENIVQQLLEKGADTAARDRSQWTALHLAHVSRHPQILRTLLENNDNVAIVNSRATASYREAQGYYEDSMGGLLERDVEIDNDSYLQQTALTRAEDAIHLEVLILQMKICYEDSSFCEKRGLLPYLATCQQSRGATEEGYQRVQFHMRMLYVWLFMDESYDSAIGLSTREAVQQEERAGFIWNLSLSDTVSAYNTKAKSQADRFTLPGTWQDVLYP